LHSSSGPPSADGDGPGRHEARRAAGLCVRCGRARDGEPLCAQCRANQRKAEEHQRRAAASDGPGLDREPSHPLLRRWWRVLREDFEQDMNRTLLVGVALAEGSSRQQMAARFGLTHGEVERACHRLERVAERIARDKESAPEIERSGVTS
jgi:hypothetical protein